MAVVKLVGLVAIVLCVWFASSGAHGEIYKWKDAQGRWQFSDKAPSEGAVTTRVKLGSQEKGVNESPTGENLAELLEQRFKPDSVIEQTTLGVVGIETRLGSGSGFFVSRSGHIITNKHVIRPESSTAHAASLKQQEKLAALLEKRRSELDKETSRLRNFEDQLRDYKREIDRKPEGGSRKVALEEYRRYKQQLDERSKQLLELELDYQRQFREHQKVVGDFRLNNAMASAARRFTIYLKDNSVHTATLVRVSPELDLALLKLDGFITPALSFGDERSVRQGHAVFAVGSPLGMRDSVTSGIITGIRQDYLITDTQILPGNSGGPLVSNEGQVIGVNTMKYSQGNALTQGFGMAIPITQVLDEFREITQ